MAIFLYVVGALAFLAGIVTTYFGVSIELSFGNSLIIAGSTATVGGLILIGLGAAVGQLQRVTDALMSMRAPIRPGFEMPARPARAPFPPKPPAGEEELAEEAHAPEPPVAAAAPALPPMPAEAPAHAAEVVPEEEHFPPPPLLRNPDLPPVPEEVSLTPPPPERPETREPLKEPVSDWRTPLPPEKPELGAPLKEPAFDWRSPPQPERQSARFESMWPPAEPKPPKAPVAEQAQTETKFDVPPREPQRSAAILKSGVVDGMGYTLYVDGSIEAELPQGTLRFASINDLRSYLEKNG